MVMRWADDGKGMWHPEPCEYCDGASPWNEKYKTCPVHSILPCTCESKDYKVSFEHYCPRHGRSSNVIAEKMDFCDKCGMTLHSTKHSQFIGSDGGSSFYTCLTCGCGFGII